MKNARKLIALLLAAVMVFALAACGTKETVPDSTSENVGLFISADGSAVVDRSNTVTSNYTVDKKGNIVNINGNTIVKAANTSVYVPVTGLTVTGAEGLTFPLVLPVGNTGALQPVTIDLRATLAPLTATCKQINVVSDNPNVAEVQNSANTIGLGSDSVTVSVTLKAAGSANLIFESPTVEGRNFTVTIAVSAVAGEGAGFPVVNPDGTVTNPTDPTNPAATANPNATADPNASPNASPDASPSGTGRTGYVTGDGVNFRESASTNGKVIDTLSRGTQITIYNITNGWAQVTYGNRTGYISSTYVSYDKPAAATPTPTTSVYDPFGDNPTTPNPSAATAAPESTYVPSAGDPFGG